jgi:hypothetical protein
MSLKPDLSVGFHARRIWDDVNQIEQTTISWAAATTPLRKLKQPRQPRLLENGAAPKSPKGSRRRGHVAGADTNTSGSRGKLEKELTNPKTLA